MALIDLQVPTSIHIDKFSGSSIAVASAYVKNAIFDKYPDGRVYSMQRPSFDIFSDASVNSKPAKGRGIHYWNDATYADTYIVNNDTFYRNNYGGISYTLTGGGGFEKVWMTELGGDLCLADPENNEFYTFNGSAMTAVGDAQCPVNISGKTLAHGCVVLDQTLYLLTTDGIIYGSDIANATSWDALNIITAEKSEDGGVCIARHYNSIVVFGNATIEYFYNAANPVGSPLSTHVDVSYNIGCVDGNSVASNGDMLFFAGLSATGEVGVYMLNDFAPTKISSPSIDSFLTVATQIDNAKLIGSTFGAGGKLFYVLTLYQEVGGVITPDITLVSDLSSQMWAEWEHGSADIDSLPIIGWTTSTTARKGQGILANGDAVNVFDDFNPQDTVAGVDIFEPTITITGTSDVDFNNATTNITTTTTDLSQFGVGDTIDVTGTVSNNTSFTITGTPTASAIETTVAPTNESSTSATLTREGVFEAGVFSLISQEGDDFEWLLRFPRLDGGNRNNKLLDEIRIRADQTDNSAEILVKWSDDNHSSFNTGRTIDLNRPEQKLVSCGKFRSRTIELSYTGDETIRIEGISAEVRGANK